MKALTFSAAVCLGFYFFQSTTAVVFPGYESALYGTRFPKYSATASGSIWTVLFKIEVPVDYAHTVLSVRAVDEQNANEISTDAQCIDDSVELVVSAFNTLEVTVIIDTANLASGPCFVQSDTSGTGVKLKFQTFESSDTSTPGTYSVYFAADIPSSDLGQVQFASGEYVTDPPVPAVALTAPTITVDLKIVDSDGSTELTSSELGDIFKLRVEVETNPYKDYIDVAGAIVHTCSMATNSDMTENAHTFIAADSCLVSTAKIFSSSTADTGFSRDGTASNGLTGTTPSPKTYVAISMNLEAAAILESTISTSTTLHFQCSLTFCYDDSTGQCGGNHCPRQARKKREIPRTDTIVRTKLEIVQGTKEKPTPCAETVTFKATLGTLGTTSIILFFGVIFSITSWRRTKHKHQARKSGFASSKTTGSSRTTMEDSLSTCSSSVDGRSMKC